MTPKKLYRWGQQRQEKANMSTSRSLMGTLFEVGRRNKEWLQYDFRDDGDIVCRNTALVLLCLRRVWKFTLGGEALKGH